MDGGMEITFRNRQLERYYAQSKAAVREFGAAVARRYIERINVIKSARSVSEVLALPGLHGHELKGDRAGQYSVRLTGYVRLIFTVREDDPRVICVEEVSKHYEE